MSSNKELYRDRIETIIDIWDKILKGEVSTRTQLEELLYIAYRQRGIEPFRGLSKIRIYDKEIATVYLVGKYGLGLDDDVMRGLKYLFNIELICDQIFTMIKGNGYGINDEVKRKILELLDNSSIGVSREDRIFRLLRFVFTGTILNFFTEEDFTKCFKVIQQVLSEINDPLSQKVINYVKFYVAFKLAEQIALGEIKSFTERKIMKYAYCVKIDVPKCAPSDKLIREVALRVYKVPKKILDKLFPNESSKSPVPNATHK